MAGKYLTHLIFEAAAYVTAGIPALLGNQIAKLVNPHLTSLWGWYMPLKTAHIVILANRSVSHWKLQQIEAFDIAILFFKLEDKFS